MLTEIDKDFYCGADFNVPKKGFEIGYCQIFRGACGKLCSTYHRKHPTPEQFKKEYGEEWTGAVYATDESFGEKKDEWCIYENEEEAIRETYDAYIVCACTPYGIPDKDWRPE